MKQLFSVLLAIGLALLPLTAARAGVDDFVIKSFDGEYLLHRDARGVGNMLVRETIVAEFPEFDQNHGILRSIPLDYNDYSLGLDIISVTDESGQAWAYTTSEAGGQLVLKIGDADKFVHGLATYEISYSMENVIDFTNQSERFFWDINGSGWSQLFESVTARVVVSSELADALTADDVCYTGVFGSSRQDCTTGQVTEDGQTVISASAEDLGPSETLSLSVGFENDTFYKDPWPLFWNRLAMSLVVVVPLATSVYMIRRWRKYGRDPAGRGVIIPQYQPPEELDVLGADVILNERLKTNAISASLISLAINGYLRLHEIEEKKLIGSKTKYQLELLETDKPLSVDQAKIIKAIFGSNPPGTKVDLSTQANKLYSTMASLGKQIPGQLAKSGYFTREPSKVRTQYILIAVGLVVAGFLLIFFAPALYLAIGLFISAVIVAGFANAMPARTLKGVAMRDYLLGLKDYMKLAEADRIKYLQSPEGVKQYGEPGATSTKVHLFEALLPFAMLLGIEKDWAKQFEHLYDQPPEWFNSNARQFSAVHLAGSLGSFNTATATAFTPPSSSGSSGGSFSGGGGGGGGGGGW